MRLNGFVVVGLIAAGVTAGPTWAGPPAGSPSSFGGLTYVAPKGYVSR